MVKSSLFDSLFEGAGSNKGSKFQDRVNAQLDKDIQAQKQHRKEKEDKTPSPKRGSVVAKGDLESEYIKTKASYGNLYVQDKTGLDSLLNELDVLPFRFSFTKTNSLLISIKNISFSSIPEFTPIHTALSEKKNAALSELADILGYSGPISIDVTKPLEAQLQPVPKYSIDSTSPGVDSNAYAAIVGLVFPFIDRDLLDHAIATYPNITTALATYASAYNGTLLSTIDWASGENIPDFSTFEHITDPIVRKFLQTIKNVLTNTTEGTLNLPPRLVRLGHRGIQEATTGFKTAISGSIANNKHKSNLVKTIYYSLITRALPYNADLFELNAEGPASEVKKFFDNPDTADISNLLTDKARTLIAARILSVEQNPFLYKGLLGSNSRKQIAFDYAKRVLFKKRKEAIINEKTTDKIASLFDNALRKVPGMSEHFDKLATIFDTYFGADSESLGEDKASKLKVELDAFVDEGQRLLEMSPSNEEYATLFKPLLAKLSEYSEEGLPDIQQLIASYIVPFKEAIISRLTLLREITTEDISAVYQIGEACTSFLAGELNKKQIQDALETFRKYDTEKASSGKDEGYKFLRLVSNVQSIIQQADKQLKKSKHTEEEASTTPQKSSLEKSIIQRNAIKRARSRILDSKHILQTLSPKIAKVLLDIKNRFNALSPEIQKALISGNYSEETSNQIDSFITNTVKSIYDTHFGPSGFGLLSSLPMKPEDFNAESSIIKRYVELDLKEKTKNGLLIADGTLNSYVNYYDGLTEDFINFINLAAAIQEGYKGISVTPEGDIDFKFALDSAALSQGFFTKFFFGDLVTKISSEPVVTLAAHRTILKRLQTPLQQVLTATTGSDILLPTVQKNQPKLAKQLQDYFTGLYKVANTGIKTAIEQIDKNIIALAGNSNISIIEQTPSAIAATQELRSYYIPATTGDAFEKSVTLLGAKAIALLSKVPSANTASKEFFRQIFISGALTGESETLQIYFKNALDIISTAINIDIARQTFYGDNAQIEAVKALVKKYQSEGNADGINDIRTAKTYADTFVNTFMKQSGAIGTKIITATDNHIDNPLLFAVLQKFDTFISQDSWSEMETKYADIISKERKEGTYIHSDINKVIEKLGLAYRRIGQFTTVTEAVDPTINQSNTDQPTSTNLLIASETGIKANPNAMKLLVKDLSARLTGTELTPLRKGQGRGQNYQQVISYTEILNKNSAAMHRAVLTLGSYLSLTGNELAAKKLAAEVALVNKNFEIMQKFFNFLASEKTISVDNIQSQKTILDILSKLKAPNYSGLFEEIFIRPLNPNSETFRNHLIKAFTVKTELSSVFELLKMGESIEDITEHVLAEINKVMASPDEDYKAKFAALADEEYQPEPNTKGSTKRQPVEHPVSSIGDKVSEFINELETQPIPSYAIFQNKDKYASRLATLYDPATYAAVKPEEAAKLKALAARVMYKGSPKDPRSVEVANKFNTSVQELISAGNIKNQITGTPVTTQLDPNKLFESVKILLNLLLEADFSNIQQSQTTQIPQKSSTIKYPARTAGSPSTAPTATEFTPNAQEVPQSTYQQDAPVSWDKPTERETYYKHIASMLMRLHVTQQPVKRSTTTGETIEVTRLTNPDGTEFSRWAEDYFMLFATDNQFAEDTKNVSRFFNTKDELEFKTAKNFMYAKISDFNKIQDIILANYNATENE